MEVKTIIKQKGFTMEAVAKKMGITRITLAQNLSRNPTVGTLQKIADVIGCKVGDFFVDDMDIKMMPTLSSAPIVEVKSILTENHVCRNNKNIRGKEYYK
ncbi:helix-turn-helix domain-containing protein [Bacteroides fragilis]